MPEEVAVVETKEVSLDQLGMSDYKKARNDGATTVVTQKVEPVEDKDDSDKEADAKEASEQDKPKSKGGFQKRIDRLVKQAAVLEEQLAAERAKGAAKSEEKKTVVEGEPQRSEFGTEYEYLKALTRWEVKQEIKEQKETEEREEKAAKEREYVKAYNEKAIEAAARYDDWKEVMSQDVSIPAIVGEALVHTIKNGPDVAYYLGKHPETCEKMMQSHPLEAVAMAVKISDQISKSGKDDDSADDEDEIEDPKPAAKSKPVSKAPEPVKPIKGGSAKSSVPLDQMSLADYKKARAAGRIT